MPYFCVNKCGVSVPIYTDTDGTTKIGNLLPREACGYDNMWGGDGAFCHVYFLSSNGTMRWGFLNYPPFDALDWKAINYVETASGWQQVKTSKYSYGFVDTGLSQASGADKIAMYGSW